jgi:hypothetical protein
MGKKSKRYMLLAIAILAAIAVFIGYRVWNKPHRDIKDAEAVGTSAIALYEGLSANAADPKQMYLNKVVKVSGEIGRISENQQGQQVIFLKTKVPGGSVNCTMEEKINHLKTGDRIILKGLCSGYIGGDPDMDLPGDVFLIRCYPSS